MQESDTTTWDEFLDLLCAVYREKHPDFQALATEIDAVVEPLRQSYPPHLTGPFKRFHTRPLEIARAGYRNWDRFNPAVKRMVVSALRDYQARWRQIQDKFAYLRLDN